MSQAQTVVKYATPPLSLVAIVFTFFNGYGLGGWFVLIPVLLFLLPILLSFANLLLAQRFQPTVYDKKELKFILIGRLLGVTIGSIVASILLYACVVYSFPIITASLIAITTMLFMQPLAVLGVAAIWIRKVSRDAGVEAPSLKNIFINALTQTVIGRGIETESKDKEKLPVHFLTAAIMLLIFTAVMTITTLDIYVKTSVLGAALLTAFSGYLAAATLVCAIQGGVFNKKGNFKHPAGKIGVILFMLAFCVGMIMTLDAAIGKIGVSISNLMIATEVISAVMLVALALCKYAQKKTQAIVHPIELSSIKAIGSPTIGTGRRLSASYNTKRASRNFETEGKLPLSPRNFGSNGTTARGSIPGSPLQPALFSHPNSRPNSCPPSPQPAQRRSPATTTWLAPPEGATQYQLPPIQAWEPTTIEIKMPSS